MDDSCAVCAETLQWVAYGPCGHKEVCSTCIIRLRFICADSTCCICKSVSNSVFVTKALGEYTTVISDFGSLPENPKEGKVGNYWYHQGTGAYFDDLDHYKTVKAMCRLSCSVCDKGEGHRNGGRKRNAVEFDSIEHLKGHLFHRHKLFMCSLCLGSRKVFISEQKLYNRAQLSQHVKTGDSEVDGSESERGGFMGHPMCEFCSDPFYGDNELYLHMSTDHFTCHICRRQNPGKYEYYRNYDDLEMHFRHQHFLCEDENCLAKKFIVFASESEMKRHNVMEHGGRMSRSKRKAALQIPVSFQYRQGDEQDRHSRGRVNHLHSFDNQPIVVEGHLETASTGAFRDTSLNDRMVSGHRDITDIELIVNPFESLTTADPEPSSRNHHILGSCSTTASLEDSSFPPLPSVPRNSQIKSRKMAACLRKHILNSSRTSPATIQHSSASAGDFKQSSSISDARASSSSSLYNHLQSRQSTVNDNVPPNHGSCSQAGQLTLNGLLVSSNSASSSRTSISTGNTSRSVIAPTFRDRGAFEKCSSNFPSSSSAQVNGERSSSQPRLEVEDVRQANKALVKKIRVALEFDEDKFSAFKIISSEYRQNIIGTAEYLAYVYQFGLSDFVLELAKLCPDAQKQTELIEIYNSNTWIGSNGMNSIIQSVQSESKKSSKKGKGKCEEDGIRSTRNPPAEGLNGIRDAYSLKNGDHSAKGKSKIVVDEHATSNSLTEPRGGKIDPSAGGGMKKDAGAGEGNKPRKKASKFLRNRLGETSENSDAGRDENADRVDGSKEDKSVGLPVRGVWQNGGGQKLVAMTQRHHKEMMMYRASWK